MSQSFRRTSVENATGTTTGDPEKTKGHNSIGLAVAADNLDAANDTLEVRLEVEVDGNWMPLLEASPITTADLEDVEGNGTFAAARYEHGVAVEQVRAAITSFTDASGGDLSVDAYVLGTNNAGSGRGYRER